MSLKETIEKWCLDIQHDLAQERPNDKWPDEVTHEVTETNKGFNAKIEGASYVYWLDMDRGPTSDRKKGRLYGIIKAWVQEKGITAAGINQNSLAFLIARKIDRQGYIGKDFLGKVINDNRIEKLNSDLTVLYVKQIRSNIIKQWQSLQ